MPRPGKNDPIALIIPLVDDFARRVSTLIEQFTSDRVNAVARVNGRAPRTGAGVARRAQRRGKTLCYYPRCKNVAAPRFGMFAPPFTSNCPKRPRRSIARRTENDRRSDDNGTCVARARPDQDLEIHTHYVETYRRALLAAKGASESAKWPNDRFMKAATTLAISDALAVDHQWQNARYSPRDADVATKGCSATDDWTQEELLASARLFKR